jgi:hypothetical protein
VPRVDYEKLSGDRIAETSNLRAFIFSPMPSQPIQKSISHLCNWAVSRFAKAISLRGLEMKTLAIKISLRFAEV